MRFEKSYTNQLRADEDIVEVIHPSLAHYRRSIALWTALLLLDVFFFYPLLSFGVWGVAVFFLVLLAVALGAVRVAYVWSRNVCILTTQRLIDIDQRSFFERFVAECPLEQIQDIRYTTSGLAGMVFRVGRVIVDTGSPAGHIELVDVREPAAVKERIMNAHHNNIRKDYGEQEI